MASTPQICASLCLTPACSDRQSEALHTSSPREYPSTPCWWDRNFPVFRRGGPCLDSWGWVRGVATRAMKCFLFLFRGSSEACRDHRRSRWARSGLEWCQHNKKTYVSGAVAGTRQNGDSYLLLFTAVRNEGRNIFTRWGESTQQAAWCSWRRNAFWYYWKQSIVTFSSLYNFVTFTHAVKIKICCSLI